MCVCVCVCVCVRVRVRVDMCSTCVQLQACSRVTLWSLASAVKGARCTLLPVSHSVAKFLRTEVSYVMYRKVIIFTFAEKASLERKGLQKL